ncbi:unnamed protein product [Ixodes persulcatus]
MSTAKKTKRAKRSLGQEDDVLEEPTKHRAVAVSRSVRLSQSFFGVSCDRLARALLGKVLARRLPDDTLLRCRIVETECYPGGDDRASSSFQGRRTESNEPLYMEPGTAYVYLTYGMYHCFNISSEGGGAAVLLRAAVPQCPSKASSSCGRYAAPDAKTAAGASRNASCAMALPSCAWPWPSTRRR